MAPGNPRPLDALEDGDEVVVRVTAPVASASPGAWLAAYSPAGADVTEQAPVKFAVLRNVTGEWEATGVAEVRFALTKMRSDYHFVLFESDLLAPQNATVLAQTDPVAFADPLAPRAPRAVFVPGAGGSGGQLAVAWSSGRGAEHASKLRWQVAGAGGEWTLQAASVATYGVDDFCGGFAASFGWRDPGYVHMAPVVGAAPGATLELQLEDDSATYAVPHTLRVPRAAGEAGTRLALFADMGRGDTDDAHTWLEYGFPAENVSRALAADEPFDAHFLFGDLSYAQGFASVWDDWFRQIEKWAVRAPLLANLGNHEFDAPADAWREGRRQDLYFGGDSGGECGVAAAAQVPTPRASLDEAWWSQQVGNVQVISMNTEVDFTCGSDQWRFLRNALAAVDRAVTPWVVFGGHRPALIDSTYDRASQCCGYGRAPPDCAAPPDCPLPGDDPSDQGVMQNLQKHLGPLFEFYDVDLLVWGHNHVYQRLCAYADGECTQLAGGAPGAEYTNPGVHLVVGSAGATLSNNSCNAQYTEAVYNTFGYINLTAVNATTMVGAFVEAAAGPGGTVLDSFVLRRPEGGRPAKSGPEPGCDEQGQCVCDYLPKRKPAVTVCEGRGGEGGAGGRNVALVVAIAAGVVAVLSGLAVGARWLVLRRRRSAFATIDDDDLGLSTLASSEDDVDAQSLNPLAER